jgi:hypothetical protein
MPSWIVDVMRLVLVVRFTILSDNYILFFRSSMYISVFVDLGHVSVPGGRLTMWYIATG